LPDEAAAARHLHARSQGAGNGGVAPNNSLPLDFNALSKPDKNLDYGKLFLAIAKSPGKIGALMELQKKTKFAAEQLADVLEKIIW